MERSPRPPGAHLDFITALPLDECMRELRHGARGSHSQRLRVRVRGSQVWIESAGDAPAYGRPGTWLLRFEGRLSPTTTGTHVQGSIVRNRRITLGLASVGVIPASLSGLGLLLWQANPGQGEFMLLLALPLVTLFAVFYANYRWLLHQQERELAHAVYEWLTMT